MADAWMYTSLLPMHAQVCVHRYSHIGNVEPLGLSSTSANARAQSAWLPARQLPLSSKVCVTRAVHQHLCMLVLLVGVMIMQCWSALPVESEQR